MISYYLLHDLTIRSDVAIKASIRLGLTNVRVGTLFPTRVFTMIASERDRLSQVYQVDVLVLRA